MKTSEKLSRTRGFVSPSMASDIHPSTSNSSLVNSFDWKTPAAMMVGGFLLKRFPRASMLGLLAAGAYWGYTKLNKKDPNPFKGEGIANLH
ncbi:hypothetical protein AZI86_10565 [Bdellovibrio bacteriovorus]|uniref:Uncharacterized protein n=1 Tax=Bdellovibrio bacteriovorus TaxID=959 RepID=A0A150WKW4_BDEBC|nr:hypothetical protein [Bdellovibrio bacteriovorus]KYG64649.1 hypothetical protein AZI86_10565 [Bdellovibrio bacteriovorus]